MTDPTRTPTPSHDITSRLQVSGMSCGACAKRVERALRQSPSTHDVAVSLETGVVTVQHDASVGAQALATAVTGAGYPATPLDAAATSS